MNDTALEIVEQLEVEAPPKKLSGAQRRKLLRAPVAFTPVEPKPPRMRQQAQLRTITGDYGSAEYQMLRAAYRQHRKVPIEGRGFYVQAVTRQGEQFRAIVQIVRGPKQ